MGRFLTENAGQNSCWVHNTLSRLDFCIELSAYGSTTFCLVRALQNIQNFAARLVILELYDPDSHHHSTLLEKENTGFPLQNVLEKAACIHVLFYHATKLMVLVLLTSQNCYLSSLRLLHSPDTRIQCPKSNNINFINAGLEHGFRGFFYFGPRIWNSLPQDLGIKQKTPSFAVVSSQQYNTNTQFLFQSVTVFVDSVCVSVSHCVCGFCVCLSQSVCVRSRVRISVKCA